MFKTGWVVILGTSLLASCGSSNSEPGGRTRDATSSGGTSVTSSGGAGGAVTSVGGTAGGSAGAGGVGTGGSSASTNTSTGGSTGGATRAPTACRPTAPCPSGWFEYTDTICSPPYIGSGAGCGQNPSSDHLCYPLCDSAFNCSDPLYPTCGSISVFNGSDAGQIRRVCKPSGTIPLCQPGAGGGGGTGGTGGTGGQSGAMSGGSGGSGGRAGNSGSAGQAGMGSAGIGSAGAGAGGSTEMPDGGGDMCAAPLPVQCGDRLQHSTLVQGRADVWRGYNATQRLLSGRETLYALTTPSACSVVAQLQDLTVDLDLLLLTACNPGSNTLASSTPLDLQTVETLRFSAAAAKPLYLVVDGYDGAAGSYTLTVDCTCS